MTPDESDYKGINRSPDYLRESFSTFLRMHNINPALVFEGSSPAQKRSSRPIARRKKLQATQSNTKPGTQASTPARDQTRLKKNASDPLTKRYDIFLSWPLNKRQCWISSYYGWRQSKGQQKFHYGLDLAALKGTQIKAAGSGVVIQAGRDRGYGNTIVVKHTACYKTRYAHLDRIMVTQGQTIQRGDPIGTVGDTGNVRSKTGKDASHLHFEVLAYDKHINPLSVLS